MAIRRIQRSDSSRFDNARGNAPLEIAARSLEAVLLRTEPGTRTDERRWHEDFSHYGVDYASREWFHTTPAICHAIRNGKNREALLIYLGRDAAEIFERREADFKRKTEKALAEIESKW